MPSMSSTQSMLSSVVQPDRASRTTNDLLLPSHSSLSDDNVSGLRPTMFQRVTTPSELQTQSHTVATTGTQGHSMATSSDHSEPMDSHNSESISAELINSPGN